MSIQLTDEHAFKLQFISNFLSTWCANEYKDACMRGEQERLEEPPVDNAQFLADTARAFYVRCML